MHLKSSAQIYAKLAEFLESQIAVGNYRAGDKLPTRRELATQFELTGYAVQQCFEYLAAKGVVTLRHGSGVYVAESRQHNSNDRNITVYTGNKKIGPGYLFHTLLGIQEEALLQGCSVTLRAREYYQCHQQYEDNLTDYAADTQGIILLGEYDSLPFQPPANLPSCGVEMADNYHGVLSPITLDPFVAAELAADYFRRRGITKLCILTFAAAPVFAMRAECLRQLWEKQGGSCVVEEFTPWLEHTARLPFQSGCGYYFCSGSWCELSLRQYEREHGAGSSRELPVLSVDGKSRLVPEFLPVSCIAINWKEAGKTAFNELRRRIDNPGSESHRIYINPKLYEI